MYEMKCEESKKAILYLMTGVGCTPDSIDATLFNVMAAEEIIQAYAI